MPPRTAEHSRQFAGDHAESSAATNPCVFLVGCPRSGTTLLQRMLTEHPQLAVTNDIEFIVETLSTVYPEVKKRRIARGRDPAMKPEVADCLLQSKRFASMGLPENRVREIAAQCETYKKFVTAVYDEFARIHAKPLAGDKSPDYARRIPMLHALFPQARFIHIIRDGRDVALSTLEWAAKKGKGPCHFALWNDHPLATTALWWRWLVRSGRRDGAALGPALYHEIRYERLVADPETVLREIADFLALPFAHQMLNYHQKCDKRSRPGHRHRLPPTPGMRDWTSQMKPSDAALYHLLAGDLLSELGYASTDDAPDDELRNLAEYCRNWWSKKPSRVV